MWKIRVEQKKLVIEKALALLEIIPCSEWNNTSKMPASVRKMWKF